MRIPVSLLRRAYARDALLARLLPPCRDLHAAQNELRWLREHVNRVAQARRAKGDIVSRRALLRALVKQRASGKPLQYLLGSEFFGDLQIRCRPGVLIPRQDTAASVQRLVRLIRDAQNLPSELRVLDLCTGTGCIPLLFHHELYTARDDIDLRLIGVDLSDEALRLAAYNLRRLRRDRSWVDKGSTHYIKADILNDPFAEQDQGPRPLMAALNYARLPPFWDILISNPPYISPSAYWKTTTRSVRLFEPKLALVPRSTPHVANTTPMYLAPRPREDPTARLEAGNADTAQGDAFYPPLLSIACQVEAKIVLLEIADLDQALRVARAARALHIFDGIEIWREQPDAPHHASAHGEEFPVLGQGHARSVLCWRGAGTKWLGKSSTADAYDAVAFPAYAPSVAAFDKRRRGTFPITTAQGRK